MGLINLGVAKVTLKINLVKYTCASRWNSYKLFLFSNIADKLQDRSLLVNFFFLKKLFYWCQGSFFNLTHHDGWIT